MQTQKVDRARYHLVSAAISIGIDSSQVVAGYLYTHLPCHRRR
jgi:hypothetical protein